MCINCIYGNGKPVTCCVCEGPLRGGFCLFCDSKDENSFICDPNAYITSNNFNYLPQPQYENYLCKLCRNNLHYGYDCQQQFSLVYEESHVTFQCQPMNQNTYSSGFNQIQTPQYPKLIEDLKIVNKELAECINSPSWDCPTFFNDNEDHSVQYKEYLENPSNEITASNSNQEKEKPPQDSNIRQLIREECCIEVCRKQKQNMEDTMLELVEVCRQKEFHCMHDNVDDLIESALNSKLLSINLESQLLDKKKQEVRNIMEQPTKCGTRIAKSLQNFRVIHKTSSISLNNTSQISSIHAIAPVLPTEESEYSLSMGYEHLSTIQKTESDEIIESCAKNLLPIPSEYEVTFDDENPHYFNDESDFVKSLSNRDTLIDSSPKFDFLEEFSGAIMPTSIADEERIRREHAKYISLTERLFTINPCPRQMENSNTIFETLPTYHIPLEDSDSQREKIDIFTSTDDLLPLGIESDDYDSEWDINVLEELLVDNSISLPKNESFYFDHQDDPSFPRPPSEPPDVEFDFEPNSGEVISAVMNNIDELNEDECFDPGGEIDVSTNIEDDDYFPFMFVIRIFLPYLIYPEVFLLLLSAGSEDTILTLASPFKSRWHLIGMELSYALMFIQILMKARFRFSFPFALSMDNRIRDRVKLNDSTWYNPNGLHTTIINLIVLRRKQGLDGGGYLRDYVRVVDRTDDEEKGTEIMKDKVSQEHVCEEEVILNNNIGKQSGDLVEMPSEAVEQGMYDHMPDKIDGAKRKDGNIMKYKSRSYGNHLCKPLLCKHLIMNNTRDCTRKGLDGGGYLRDYVRVVDMTDDEGKQSGDLVEMPSEAVEQGMYDHMPDKIDGAKCEHVPNHVVNKGNLEVLVCKQIANHGGDELVNKERPLKRKM
nr:hypothetical protein [Tanacetum cinerariifolium]